MDANPVRGELRLAANVVFTRLPFGGGVLLHGRTLALAECDERDAEIVSHLLAGDPADSGAEEPADDAAADAARMRMAVQLLEAGWLTAVPEQR